MSAESRCKAGDWVEIERVLLEPEDRSANLPEDTASQPLVTWVKGYALSEADLGEDVSVETMTGRTVTGALSAIRPGYTHTFGQPPAQIVSIGRDLRAQLAAYRAGGPRG